MHMKIGVMVRAMSIQPSVRSSISGYDKKDNTQSDKSGIRDSILITVYDLINNPPNVVLATNVGIVSPIPKSLVFQINRH
jgi:hypothetical protein